MEIKLAVIYVSCLLFCIINRGDAAGCALSNIVVTQRGTGGWAHGQPEYAVTVKNTCSCPQSNVKVACDGFSTTQWADPATFRPAGDGRLCLLNSGDPIVRGRDLTFLYAWSEQFKFPPVSSTLECK